MFHSWLIFGLLVQQSWQSPSRQNRPGFFLPSLLEIITIRWNPVFFLFLSVRRGRSKMPQSTLHCVESCATRQGILTSATYSLAQDFKSQGRNCFCNKLEASVQGLNVQRVPYCITSFYSDADYVWTAPPQKKPPRKYRQIFIPIANIYVLIVQSTSSTRFLRQGDVTSMAAQVVWVQNMTRVSGLISVQLG